MALSGFGKHDRQFVHIDHSKIPLMSAAVKVNESRSQAESTTSSSDSMNDHTADQTKSNKKRIISEKRAEQNRKAQRLFRQRREEHIKMLEAKAAEFDAQHRELESLRMENESLKQMVASMFGRNNFDSNYSSDQKNALNVPQPVHEDFGLIFKEDPQPLHAQSEIFGMPAFHHVDTSVPIVDQSIGTQLKETLNSLPAAFGGKATYSNNFLNNDVTLAAFNNSPSEVDFGSRSGRELSPRLSEESLYDHPRTPSADFFDEEELFGGALQVEHPAAEAFVPPPIDRTPVIENACQDFAEGPLTEKQAAACAVLDKKLDDESVDALCTLMRDMKYASGEHRDIEFVKKVCPTQEKRKKFWKKIMCIASKELGRSRELHEMCERKAIAG